MACSLVADEKQTVIHDAMCYLLRNNEGGLALADTALVQQKSLMHVLSKLTGKLCWEAGTMWTLIMEHVPAMSAEAHLEGMPQ